MLGVRRYIATIYHILRNLPHPDHCINNVSLLYCGANRGKDNILRLQDWIKTLGFGGQTWLAGMMNVSPKTVNEWVHLRRSPKPQSRNKIRRISGGKVDFSLFDLEYEQAKAERAA